MGRITIIVQDVNEASVEELILSKANLKVLNEGYQDLGVNTPEYILDKIVEITRELDLRIREDLLRELKKAQAQRASLATLSEKRQGLDSKILDLQKRLGQP